MFSVGTQRRPRQHRIPLGLVLLSRGLIDNQSLQEALQAQRQSRNGRLGEWLMRLGAVNEDQVTAAVAIQWGCPVFPLEGHNHFIDCAGMVPLPILEAARMAIVDYLPTGLSLYVAFANGIDHCTLRALEEMFRCRTQPCIARESSLEHALEVIRSLSRPPEIMIDNTCHPLEMAQTLRGYAAAKAAEQVRIVKCEAYIWAQLEKSSRPTNVLFRASGRNGS
jgi:Type II secretion system (T2SS), protein E, N-terminal domain